MKSAHRHLVLLALSALFTLAGISLPAQSTPIIREAAEFFARYRDPADNGSISAIDACYITSKDGVSCEDMIRYRRDANGNLSIEGTTSGELSTGLYTVRFLPGLIPATFEHSYRSAIENLDFWDSYVYESPRHTRYVNKKNGSSRRIDHAPGFADSVTIMEYLVFADPARMPEIHLGTVVSPGAISIPFVFRRLGEETVADHGGTTYDCWVFSAEIDNFLSVFLRLFYGDARIWVTKSFPHIRVKTEFFKKTARLSKLSITCQTSSTPAQTILAAAPDL